MRMTNKDKDRASLALACLLVALCAIFGAWRLGYEQGREAWLKEFMWGMRETGTTVEMIYLEDLEQALGE